MVKDFKDTNMDEGFCLIFKVEYCPLRLDCKYYNAEEKACNYEKIRQQDKERRAEEAEEVKKKYERK